MFSFGGSAAVPDEREGEEVQSATGRVLLGRGERQETSVPGGPPDDASVVRVWTTLTATQNPRGHPGQGPPPSRGRWALVRILRIRLVTCSRVAIRANPVAATGHRVVRVPVPGRVHERRADGDQLPAG